MADLYRKNVGAMVVNNNGMVLVGKRIDMPSDAWQMPQGGIDDGENPNEAVFRELFEETGINKKFVAILSEYKDWLSYDFPPDLKNRLWNGNYKGQKQKWFLLRFTGEEKDINLDINEKPEFSEYKWVKPDILPSLAVSFKQDIYKKLVEYFREYLKAS